MTTKKRTASMTVFLRTLRQMGACSEGVELVRAHSTPARWWAASDRGDHMLWLAGRVEIDRKALVLAACACARLALPHVRAGEERSRIAIETAERWARGEAGGTLEAVRTAAAAAYAAYAADAAYAAAYAADAADAYAAAAAAAYAAYAAAARTETLKACAALVRHHIPWSMVRDALKKRAP